MKIIKLLSLSLLLSVAFIFLSGAPSFAQENENLASALAEYEIDEISAENLGIEDPDVLPGDSTYWWQKLKENVSLFFTFDQEEKIAKLEEIASRRLLEAKKLTENNTENATDRVEEALEKYKEKMAEITERLKNNQNIQEKVLENFDTNQLRHQQVLSTVVEKLRNQAPQDKLEKIENIKKENALNWYNTNKKNLEKRLETAVINNEVGSKFKQLKNIATLEELSETLPKETIPPIEKAKEKAEERLAEKLEKMNPEDPEKLEKYIKNITTPEIVKQKFISDLKDSQKLPLEARKRIENAFRDYSNGLENRFQKLNNEEKNKFLNQFENKLRSHPANLDFLQNLDAPEFKEKIKELIEIQQEGLKEKIRSTTDATKLRNLEQSLREFPILRREIQEQRRNMAPAPSPYIMQQAEPAE